MNRYSFANARTRKKYFSGRNLSMHYKAFRERLDCWRCGCALCAEGGGATGLCKGCAYKLVVTCCECGEKVSVNSGHSHCEHIARIPIRAWREMVLNGTFKE